MKLHDYLIKELVDEGVWEWRAVDIVNNLKRDSFFCATWTPHTDLPAEYYLQHFLDTAVKYVLELAEKDF